MELPIKNQTIEIPHQGLFKNKFLYTNIYLHIHMQMRVDYLHPYPSKVYFVLHLTPIISLPLQFTSHPRLYRRRH